MRLPSDATTPQLSPTDLSAFSECRHRTVLDLAVARGALKRPGVNEIERQLLEKRGREHEQRALEMLRAQGRDVVTVALNLKDPAAAAAETLAAMKAGADVIYQGTLVRAGWVGRPDFLVRAATSTAAAPRYEPWDAKLARSAKAAAVLQVCAYVEALAELQGAEPERFALVLGGETPTIEHHRAADTMAYYRRASRELGVFIDALMVNGAATNGAEANGVAANGAAPSAAEPYPEPVAHCGVCQWWRRCEERRRQDDHLSLVAGLTRKHRERLAEVPVTRVVELGRLKPSARVDGIAAPTLERIREQARIQVAARGAPDDVLHELLTTFDPGAGLEALPAPTRGDLFLDLEGDAFVEGTGLDYLFGLLELAQLPEKGKVRFDFDFDDDHDDHDGDGRKPSGEPRYLSWWATNRAEEKRAFEAVIDRIVAGRLQQPELHVYHFGHRETDAIKRLACLHKTREDEVDELLRAHTFVDLHRVVKQALRASVESYGLKQLEPLYGFKRETPLRDAARAMQLFGHALELKFAEATGESSEHRPLIHAYNREDCLSTWKLRDFLESERPKLEQALERKLGRPALGPDPDQPQEKNAELERVSAELTRDLPEAPQDDTPAQRARRLLANLLDWHWREEKSVWWAYHEAKSLTPSEWVEETSALGGLRHVGKVGVIKRSEVHRYEFDEQRHPIRGNSRARDLVLDSPVDVVQVAAGTVDLLHGPKFSGPYPTALGPGKPFKADALKDSVLELGTAVVDGGPVRRTAMDLLERVPPRTRGGALAVGDSETTAQALTRVALGLDESVVSVQGPPGSGKTHLAAEVIGALLKAGKRVGVTANSHAVIQNLLAKAIDLGVVGADRVRHYDSKDATRAYIEGRDDERPFAIATDYKRLRSDLDAGRVTLVGGTAWAWSNDTLQGSVDVLVVDEAGQMSLANVISASRGARNLILVGDPTQLEQPTKGVHPEGTDTSALGHVMGDAQTLPPSMGYFLERTRRLHPAICAFTSELFYEGRLTSMPGLERQCVRGDGRLCGAGLRFVPVPHRGNSDQSEEEARAIAELVAELLDGRHQFVSEQNIPRVLRAEDVLIVAPYNAHVHLLRRHVPAGVRVGTVDKFQGKEAPVAIYSLGASSAEDAARGAEFLFEPSRLNVATSRARALAVVVASPSVLEARGSTVRGMKLANALCRFVEMAEAP